MSIIVVAASIGIIVVTSTSLAWFYYPRSTQGPLPAFILRNKVTHTRLLPTETAHAFTYPTLSVLLSLNALESHALDIGGGWLFGYGTSLGRVTGVPASAYLQDYCGTTKSIRSKLENLLNVNDYDAQLLDDAWMLTMPSFLGFEGINPLTIYFCYKHTGGCWLVVLEIHNTFGERHAHILEIGRDEDLNRPAAFDHSWTIPRQFHVSPFNDRAGFYECAVVAPKCSPSQYRSGVQLPSPIVRIHLYTAEMPRALKLTAVLRTVTSTSLSSRALLAAISQYPFALLLTFPRIAYQAFILHYRKRLAVYVRPEPCAVEPEIEKQLGAPRNSIQHIGRRGGGLGWQREGLLERYCRDLTAKFLTRRTRETGIGVQLISANPACATMEFENTGSASASIAQLKIYYRSPKLFTTLLMTPSAEHALLLGQDTEKEFSVSSRDLFVAVFSQPSCPISASRLLWLVRSLRIRKIPAHIQLALPGSHAMDGSAPDIVTHTLAIATLYMMEHLEKAVFHFIGARFVDGDEPWGGWDRVGCRLRETYNTQGSHYLGDKPC
ncbi:hypothetical protein BD410DRAFT_715281 [Rickenella mellea]|uniref:DUF1365-domain-containing protein n=1 Tax=Rickenella mellea TaxID=50990 RepID=A0A4Y7QIZ8_9AGAM|nr:hypothetical protein BD410DRAFT_715281 [Rickenella mellea]